MLSLTSAYQRSYHKIGGFFHSKQIDHENFYYSLKNAEASKLSFLEYSLIMGYNIHIRFASSTSATDNRMATNQSGGNFL